MLGKMRWPVAASGCSRSTAHRRRFAAASSAESGTRRIAVSCAGLVFFAVTVLMLVRAHSLPVPPARGNARRWLFAMSRFGRGSIQKIEVILREPERPKNPVAFTTGDQTTLEVIRNSTGSFDSFHSLRMTWLVWKDSDRSTSQSIHLPNFSLPRGPVMRNTAMRLPAAILAGFFSTLAIHAAAKELAAV